MEQGEIAMDYVALSLQQQPRTQRSSRRNSSSSPNLRHYERLMAGFQRATRGDVWWRRCTLAF